MEVQLKDAKWLTDLRKQYSLQPFRICIRLRTVKGPPIIRDFSSCTVGIWLECHLCDNLLRYEGVYSLTWVHYVTTTPESTRHRPSQPTPARGLCYLDIVEECRHLHRHNYKSRKAHDCHGQKAMLGTSGLIRCISKGPTGHSCEPPTM